MTVKRLGETFGDKTSYWYETPTGRVDCNEDTLHKLWFEWVNCLGGKRINMTNEIIYEFAEPTNVTPTEPLPYYES